MLRAMIYASVGLGVTGVVVAWAQPPGGPSIPPSTPSKPADVRAVERALEQGAARAPEHDLLTPLVGEWNVEARALVDPAGKGDPIVSRGTMKNLWVLGNRYVRSEADVGGRAELKAESMAMYGFDTRTRLFTMDRYDTLGTYAWHATGSYDAASKSIVFDGVTLVGGVNVPFRFVLNLANPDDILLQRLTPDDKGQWIVAAEFESTRNRIPIDTAPPRVAPR